MRCVDVARNLVFNAFNRVSCATRASLSQNTRAMGRFSRCERGAPAASTNAACWQREGGAGAPGHGGRAARGASDRGERARRGTNRDAPLGGAEGNNNRRIGGFENLPGDDMDYFTWTMERLHELLSVSKQLLCAKYTVLMGQVCNVVPYSAHAVCTVPSLQLHVSSGGGGGGRLILSDVELRAGTCIALTTRPRDIVH